MVRRCEASYAIDLPMSSLDLVVLLLYFVGLLAMGGVFVRRMKDTGEMFAAGGRSPWWLSGLSAFMTMFSAGTFVVWGGIAYQYGLVAVGICMCYGISALLVGWLLAGTWKRLGVQSAAEFLELRFGNSLVQFYTWLQGTVGIFGMGGSIYALAVIIAALVPLDLGHPLADPDTGRLSVTLVSLAICAVVILITFGGGLWAVLMTDVLQFIILSVAVTVVVPLLWIEVGGWDGFTEQAPDGFFLPVAGDFTWWFLAGWVAVHFFKIGAEWAFVQRFVCVPTPRDARKGTVLFGVMYLVSPIVWMLPPMLYRMVDPAADPEQAYILACQWVLPAGMMGLMVAAMSSATASMATTFLNVFAGAFTTEFYRRVLRPGAKERELVLAGRVITVMLGGLVIAGALLIPKLGTYTGWVLATTAMLSGPLMLPTIWGLFSRKIGLYSAWTVTAVGVAVGLVVKFGLGEGGWFAQTPQFESLALLVQSNARLSELVVGMAVPLGLLILIESVARRSYPGWHCVQAHASARREMGAVTASSRLPALLCGWAVAAVGIVMGVIAVVSREDSSVLGIFSAVLLVVGALILGLTWRMAEGKPDRQED